MRLTPDERVESGTRLTQRALHAVISIAGRRLTDTVVAESTAPTASAAAAWPTWRCGARSAASCCSTSTSSRRRVRLLGAADRRYVGRRVRVRLMATGRTVARPRGRRDGTFRATAPLPDAAIRATSKARHEARIRHGKVTIAGQVVQPLAAPVKTVVVKRRVSGRDWKVVKHFAWRTKTRRARCRATSTSAGRSVPRPEGAAVSPTGRAGGNRVGCAGGEGRH